MKSEEVTLLRTQVMSLVRRMRKEANSDERSWRVLTLLGAIDRYNNDVTPSFLAESEHLRSSNLATLLKQTESEGLIVRYKDNSDGRKVRVQLTRKGHNLLKENREKREQWLSNAIENNLTDEEIKLLLKSGYLLSKIAKSNSD